jgi:hypothetical protein
VLHRGVFEDRVRAFVGDDAQVCHGSLLPFDLFVLGIAPIGAMPGAL